MSINILHTGCGGFYNKYCNLYRCRKRICYIRFYSTIIIYIYSNNVQVIQIYTDFDVYNTICIIQVSNNNVDFPQSNTDTKLGIQEIKESQYILLKLDNNRKRLTGLNEVGFCYK